jgi:hypothetical protein
MSTPMVVANLNGTKTETRRIVTPQPKEGIICDANDFKKGYWCSKIKFGENPDRFEITELFKQKYQVGDILWCRETFRGIEQDFGSPRYEYKSTETINLKDKWKPNLFMPKDACRLFLEITDRRIERLNDISEQDAINEGIIPLRMSRMQLASSGQLYLDYSKKVELFNEGIGAIKSYKSLWESINGEGSWKENHWVWVVKYKRIDKPLNNYHAQTKK